MKRHLTVLLAALLAAPALAQGITLTRPATPPARTVTTPQLGAVPQGWHVLSGRIRAPGNPGRVRLPAGSTVTISLEDVTARNATGPSLLRASFSTPSLSAPYQLQFNPVRLRAGRDYAVAANVYGPNGRLLYRGVPSLLPQGQNEVMDLQVVPVR